MQEKDLYKLHYLRKNDPMWFFLDAWYETYLRWKKEGMPVSNLDTRKEILDYLLGDGNHYEWLIPNAAIKGLDPLTLNNGPWAIPVEPPFKEEILEEDSHSIIKKEYDGIIVKISKENPEGMHQYIECPVRDRKTWNEYRKRLNPFSSERFPEGWDIMTEKTVINFPLKENLKGRTFNERDFVIHMVCASLLGTPRNYMGVENLSLAMYDDPILIEEIVEHQMYFSIEIIKQVFKKGIIFDDAFIWEDIAYNKGSIFPINFIKKALVPRYRKIITLLRENGVKVINLDCDGNVYELLPLWIESGINCIYPLEVAAGMDLLRLRKQYGKNLILTGGIDKRELTKGKKEIDDQVSIVKELIKDGGYFVQPDHHMPPDISYENLIYFINEVNKLCQYEDFGKAGISK